ncbi:MAG: putative O-glycosylation ligase, exosortase A system-associated [Alphaproteobacteria bacterium]|nr:MAG: putative O-glycosylation ligase, exosortase A system-associated [Alphaproteobacteria bacterium]
MLRSLLVFILIFAALPVAVAKPHVGVLVWSWISYMNPHRLTYGMAYNFNFLDYVAAVTFVGLLFTRERKTLPNHPIVYLLIAYFVWVTITSLFAVYQELAWAKWIKFFKIILFTFITMMLMQSRGRMEALIWVIVLSLGFFTSKGGLFTILTGGAHRVWGPPGTAYTDNNEFALATVMLIPLLRYLQTQTENKLLRWTLFGMIFLSMFAIFGTQSRGGLVAIAAMLIFLIYKARKLMFGMFALGLAVIIGYFVMPESWRERMATIQNYEQDASARGRLDMWKFAIDVANDSPIVGGGFDVFYHEGYRAAYLPEGVEGRAAHSIYFEVLGEHGYVGLILFFLIGITAFFTCGAIVDRCKIHDELRWARELAAMLQVSIVGYASAGAFLTIATFDLYYHLVAITAILRVMVDKQLKALEVRNQTETGAESRRFRPQRPNPAAIRKS